MRLRTDVDESDRRLALCRGLKLSRTGSGIYERPPNYSMNPPAGMTATATPRPWAPAVGYARR